MMIRAAFECEDGVARLVVLCTGCMSELCDRLPATRRWSRPLEGEATCEFCEHEIHAEVGAHSR